MLHRPVFALFIALFFSVGGVLPAAADIAAPPSRAQLISFWETAQKSDTHTKKFERTKQKGVYQFETDFFPYKGRLKLLNAVVTRSSDTSYYPDLLEGIIEIELVDAPESFFKKHADSYWTWKERNSFYYDTRSGNWFPKSEFNAYTDNYYASQKPHRPWYSNTSILTAFLYLFIVIFLVWFVRSRSKSGMEAQKTMMDRQAYAVKIAEDSLQHQVKHTQLLKEILEDLKKQS